MHINERFPKWVTIWSSLQLSEDEIWPHLQWDFDTLAAEKRLFSIKNVVINLDSATIKWNGQFTNYHGKNR
jgi:hypothetical protein